MHTADIQAELKKRGLTQRDIADSLGISDRTVSEIINKRKVSQRIMRAVAEAIGRDPADVFEYFTKAKSNRRRAQ